MVGPWAVQRTAALSGHTGGLRPSGRPSWLSWPTQPTSPNGQLQPNSLSLTVSSGCSWLAGWLAAGRWATSEPPSHWLWLWHLVRGHPTWTFGRLLSQLQTFTLSKSTHPIFRSNISPPPPHPSPFLAISLPLSSPSPPPPSLPTPRLRPKNHSSTEFYVPILELEPSLFPSSLPPLAGSLEQLFRHHQPTCIPSSSQLYLVRVVALNTTSATPHPLSSRSLLPRVRWVSLVGELTRDTPSLLEPPLRHPCHLAQRASFSAPHPFNPLRSSLRPGHSGVVRLRWSPFVTRLLAPRATFQRLTRLTANAPTVQSVDLPPTN